MAFASHVHSWHVSSTHIYFQGLHVALDHLPRSRLWLADRQTAHCSAPHPAS